MKVQGITWSLMKAFHFKTALKVRRLCTDQVGMLDIFQEEKDTKMEHMVITKCLS